MSTVINAAGKKKTIKMSEVSFKFPEPFFFVVKVPGYKFTDEELYKIDAENENFRIESNANGDLEIMPPPFPDTSRKNIAIDARLWIWAEKDQTGVCFESSAKFTLPNGAKRMPDAAWILKERYFAFSPTEREERFTNIAPDFVIELRSKSDRLPILQKKMREYIENGVRLGWLIDPFKKRVHIYRGDKTTEVLDNPAIVSGEDVLQGFELDLTEIW
jgi:Uma2 family endonuclease